MARRWRRRSYDGSRRLHVLVNDCDRGFSVYVLNVDHFDTDDSDSDDDMDSGARRLGNRRLVVRLGGGSKGNFLAAGTRIFEFFPFSSRPGVVFDTRTRLVTTTPPFQAQKEGHAFWALGRTVYALGCHPVRRRFRGRRYHPGCFERLGPEPRPGYGKWQWEVLPPPPFEPGGLRSHAVHPDAATVFLSVGWAGTFSFDAERMVWARHGGWLLPFEGKAYYVGELDALVGISSRLIGHIAACPVPGGGRRDEEPDCKYGKDLLFSKGLKRHLEANLTYLGNAEFCLQETLAPEGESMASTSGLKVRMLLRVVTFRVKYSGDGELCAVKRRARVYKLPHLSSERQPFGFWI